MCQQISQSLCKIQTKFSVEKEYYLSTAHSVNYFLFVCNFESVNDSIKFEDTACKFVKLAAFGP